MAWWRHTVTLRNSNGQHWLRQQTGTRRHQPTDRTNADPNQLAFILMHLPENDKSNLTNIFQQALRHMPWHHSNSTMVSPTVAWWCHTATLKTQHWLRQGIGARQHQATDRTNADLNKLAIFPMHLPGNNEPSHTNKCDPMRPRQNGRYFLPDDVFKCIFLDENNWNSIKISFKSVPEGPINSSLSLV